VWEQNDCEAWQAALDTYPRVIAAQGNERLTRLDGWYSYEMPALLASRHEPYVTLEELERITSWKMTRGVWRERNRQLVRNNDPDEVVRLSRQAFAETPDPRKPIGTLSELAGVGPATASAVMAAYAPRLYPFFDELVANQIPGLGPVAFTAKYYSIYAEKLRERAAQMAGSCHSDWTAQDVAQALWAIAKGKDL
jgi:hypothetical protein